MRPKVLYVAAWGRSGTTIVDNVLDAYPSVFSAGELRYIWRRGLIQRRSCGCGRPVPDCPVWTSILKTAYGSDMPDPRRVVELQKSVRARYTYSLAHRAWSPTIVEYAGIMARLYKAIHEVTGADLIVDSSKLPAEAAILARVPEIDTYLLHMVRDARAVAHSWSRPTKHSDRPTLMMQHTPSKSTLNWCVWNVMTELVAPRYGTKRRRLRYEDLIADPRRQIEALLQLAGVSTEDGPFETPDTVRLGTNHTVFGNPRRFSVGGVQIRADDAWRTDQSSRDRLTATMIGFPVLLRYRYPLLARRPSKTTRTDESQE